MAEIAVSVAIFLVERVISVLNSDEGLSKKKASIEEVDSIKVLLPKLQAYLNVHSRGKGLQNEMQANRVTQIRDIAHNIEDALDNFMFQNPRIFHKHIVTIFFHDHITQPLKKKGSLKHLCTVISGIKSSIENLKGWDDYVNNHHGSTIEEASSSHTNWPRRCNSFLHGLEEDEIVGFKNQTATLLHQLVREEQNGYMRIFVVGPGGYGKSTLARIAYEDKQLVNRHFECSAWVKVSGSFDERKLVDDMILQLVEDHNIIKGSSVISLNRSGDQNSQLNMIKGYLRNKRYIVVLDDVCNKKDVRFIEKFLPKNSGSRIIVTTHIHDVVVRDDESPHRVHDLSSGLSEEAAWSLFSRKAFLASGGSKICPSELQGIASKILSMCGGSPNAILSVSRMLAMKPQLPAEWQAIYDTLRDKIGTDDPDCIVSKTLLRSYNDLSSALKSCFLYLSVFPRNCHIKRGRLIRLWLAEGFVIMNNTSRKKVESLADDYLDELIARNLIDVTERDFSGRAIICVVKNLVHEFLINKSSEENFTTVLSAEDANGMTSKRQLRRLSIQIDAFDDDLLKLGPADLHPVRTSFMFSLTEAFQPQIGNFISRFRLLKVLDFQGSSLRNFPKEICGLILLRYLSLRGTLIATIPSCIDKLVFIETLDLKGTQVRTLPKEIIRLSNLRYLLVYLYDVKISYVTFNSVKGVELCPEIRYLSELLKLTLIKANNPKFIVELGYLKNLRKLGLIALKTEDGEKLCTAIQKMDQLSTLDVSSVSESDFLDLRYMENPPCNLQRIYLKGRLKQVPEWISSLKSLVRVELLWSKLPVSPIPALQVSPNLIELSLVDAYIGDELVFGPGSLSKLRILKIEECMNLTNITIQDNAMLKLCKLTLSKCTGLLLPPLGIGNLLQELHALDMNDEFNAALRPSSNSYWMVEHIPNIRSFHVGRSGRWISNDHIY